MDSPSQHRAFIEHSFRRLTLLIHEQDALNATSSRSTPNSTGQSVMKPLLNKEKDNHQHISEEMKIEDYSPVTYFNDSTTQCRPISKHHRTYMRPPKSRPSNKSLLNSSRLFIRFCFCF